MVAANVSSQSGPSARLRARARPWQRALLAALLVALSLPGRPGVVQAQTDVCPEPNNGYGTACFIGAGMPTVQGVLADPADTDAYRFEVNVPLAQLHLELRDLPADYDLHLFNHNGGLLAESTSDGLTAEVIDLPVVGDTYYAFVDAALGQVNASQPYRLTVTTTPIETRPGPAGDTCPEPNDSFEQACSTTTGKLVYGTLQDTNDIDTYRYEVAEPNSLVTLRFGDAPNDLETAHFDGAGAPLGVPIQTTSLVTRRQSGVYFVQIHRPNGTAGPIPYEFLLAVTPPRRAPLPEKDACPTSSSAQGTVCLLAANVPARGYISTPSDIDTYRFEVTGVRDRVHLELTDLPGDYNMNLWTTTGQLLTFSRNTGLFPEVIDQPLDPGTYEVNVTSSNGQSGLEQPYTLSLSMAPADGGIPPAASVLFADTFNLPGRHFATSSGTDSYELGYHDGEYVVTLHPLGPGDLFQNHWSRALDAEVDDFQLDVDARVTGLPSRSGGINIPFRSLPGNGGPNEYWLAVDTVNGGGNGRARLNKTVNGAGTALTGWVDSAAIQTGSQVNHITVRAVGGSLAAAINDTPVLSASDTSYPRGSLGLGAFTLDQPSEVRFDNLLVKPAQ